MAGVGTGGTITGAGRYLKEVSGGKVKVIGADPEGSVYSGGTGRPYLVEGVGEDFWPTRVRPDDPRRDHRRLRRRLVRHDPPPGPRGGPAGRRLLRHGRGRRAARRRAAARTPSSSCCCPTVAAATCRRSSTTSGWRPTASCARRSTAERARDDGRRPAAQQVRRAAGPGAHAPVGDDPRRDRDPARVQRLADAGRRRRAARSWPARWRAASPSASCSARSSRAAPTSPTRWATTWGPPLPLIGSGRADLDDATKALSDTDALMVIEDGKPLGVITRHDLLGFLSHGK